MDEGVCGSTGETCISKLTFGKIQVGDTAHQPGAKSPDSRGRVRETASIAGHVRTCLPLAASMLASRFAIAETTFRVSLFGNASVCQFVIVF